MTKLVFGKQGNSPFVKVMVDDEADPYTTPDSDFGAFMFNSNNQELGYAIGIENDYVRNPKYTWASGTTRTKTFWPSGTGWADAHFYTITYRTGISGFQDIVWYMFLNNIYGDFGNLDVSPFVELSTGVSDTGVMNGPTNTFLYTSADSGLYQTGHWIITGGSALITINPVETPIFEDSTNSPGNTVTAGGRFQSDNMWNVITWDIPGNNMPLEYPVATPVAGQEQVRLDSSGVKIARKGFDVNDSEPNRFVLSSDRIPAKVMATGVMTLAANSFSDVYTPLRTDASTVMRFMARLSSMTGDIWTHPPLYTLNAGVDAFVTYQSMGEFVRIRNSSSDSVEIRYIIFCASADDPTTGGTMVMRRGEDYLQIKRPGSSDSEPNLNDIVLDTRLIYLTMVDEGYIPYQDMNEPPSNSLYGTIAKTINFENDGGFVPYVMYSTVYDAGGGKTFYRSAFIRILFTSTNSPYRFMPSRQSSIAEIKDNSVKFHLTRGNPFTVQVNGSNSGYVTSNSDQPNPIGIRYYIFAIPNTL